MTEPTMNVEVPDGPPDLGAAGWRALLAVLVSAADDAVDHSSLVGEVR